MPHDMNKDDERRNFFDSHAEMWEKKNYHGETLDKVKNLLQGLNLPVGGTILDVGCGQGVLIPFLRAHAGNDAHIIALDASVPMLQAISAKDPQVTAIHAPAEKMPLIDAYVNIIICFSAFPHFSNKTAAVREFFRVLKPGGKAYVLHLMGSEAISRHHDSHHAVRGDYLPCEHGMKSIFGEAGFTNMVLADCSDYYIFAALKAGDSV